MKSILIVSLSLNIFTLSAFAMYGTWLGTSKFPALTRAIVSLFVYIGSFGLGTLMFWKVVDKIAGAENS